MPELSKVKAIKEKLKQLKKKKQFWMEHYQLIGEFVHNKKQNFTEQNEPGAFLTRDLFDNTAVKSAQTASSAFIGALWPSGAQSFELQPARGISDTEEHKEFFQFVTDEMINVMDDSRAGLTVALDEYMFDQVTFGTSGIAVLPRIEDFAMPIRYNAWDVKMMFIDEDEDGNIDTIYNERSMTIRQMVKKYGYENLSAANQKLFDDGKELDKVTVIHAIEPRIKRSRRQFGNRNMPIASLHFEVKSEKILKESGFDENPILVGRLMKALGEVQGRSFAMAALPDIIEINVVWEVATVAVEKQVDPPLAILADGDLGTTIIDTSAGAINVFNITSRLGNNNPITPLFTVGDLNAIDKLIEKLTEAITGHFLIDRLLDLNNDTRMTLGEANIRNELRGASLGSIFSRQKAAIFTPLINQTFNIMFEAGRFGVLQGSIEEAEVIANGGEVITIPQEIASKLLAGEEVFKIKYISPAERSIQAEKVQGNLATLNTVLQASQVQPEVIDVIDLDALVKDTAELTGASKKVMNSLEVVQQIRKARAQQQAQQQELEQAREGSETMRNIAQAQATLENNGGGQ